MKTLDFPVNTKNVTKVEGAIDQVWSLDGVIAVSVKESYKTIEKVTITFTEVLDETVASLEKLFAVKAK